MKRTALCLVLSLLAVPAVLLAQTASSTSGALPAANGQTLSAATKTASASPRPFSRLALSVGTGIGGINMQAAVEANRHLNIRGIGNFYKYDVNNVKVSGSDGSSGVDVSGNLNLATAGIALDYYPFPKHGLRVSPGFVLYNQNSINASGTSTGASPTVNGTSITLNSVKYYSEAADPFALNASLGLNAHQQAFSLTTGWGNMISRKGHHLSFPFEIGAIFTGAPTVNLNFTGYGCTVESDAPINGSSCVNMATDPATQANIAAQIAKYQNDLNVLKVYPVFSFGVAYNFRIH